MTDSDQSSISMADAEIKTGSDDGKESEVDLVAKPFAEELSHSAKSIVENVTHSSSHVMTEVEKEVEKLVSVSDPWASPKNLGSFLKDTEETMPPSGENVVEESHETGLDENPTSTRTQQFVAATPSTQASWMNCCGLLDILRPSDQ